MLLTAALHACSHKSREQAWPRMHGAVLSMILGLDAANSMYAHANVATSRYRWTVSGRRRRAQPLHFQGVLVCECGPCAVAAPCAAPPPSSTHLRDPRLRASSTFVWPCAAWWWGSPCAGAVRMKKKRARGVPCVARPSMLAEIILSLPEMLSHFDSSDSVFLASIH